MWKIYKMDFVQKDSDLEPTVKKMRVKSLQYV